MISRNDRRDALDLAVVTGPHRSGTTFLAELLAAAPNTVSVGVEPLNVTYGLRGLDEWYPDIEPGDRTDRRLQRVRTGRRVAWKSPGDTVADRLRARRRGVRRNRRLSAAGRAGRTVILKDPFLSLSLAYATALTSRPVLVSFRHPCAWSMSLRRVDWHPGPLLGSARARPALAGPADRLGLPERDWSEVPMLEAAAWLWTLLVAAIEQQQAELGDRIVAIPLETFEVDPVAQGLTVIERMGLQIGPGTRRAIEDLTLAGTTVPTDATTHVLRRDTRSSVGAWRTRLNQDEQRLVWDIASPVASAHYEP